MACTICGEAGHNRSNCPRRQQEQPHFNGKVFFALLGALLVFLGVAIWQLPRISQYDFGTPTFVVLVLAASLAAVLMFGLLHSSGTLRGHKWGFYLELGGAAAFFGVVLAVGLYYEISQRRGSFAFTIYLVSAGDERTIIRGEGTITLRTNPPRNAEFHNGVAEFRELPTSANGQDVDYTIDVKGYKEAANAPKQIKLQPGATLNLFVQPKQEVAKGSSSESKTDSTKRLATALDDAVNEIGKLTSRDDRIAKLTITLNKHEDEVKSIKVPEIVLRVAGLHFRLAQEYEGVHNFAKARTSLENEFFQLKKIYDQDPLWTFDSSSGPVAVHIARNRLYWVFTMIAQQNDNIDDSTRLELRRQIETAGNALLRIPVKDEVQHAALWLPVCIAYMANANVKEAKSALEEAYRHVGQPTTAKAELQGRRRFYFHYYLLAAAIGAEERRCSDAASFVTMAKKYQDDELDPQGVIGFTYLLIARASPTDKDLQEALENSIRELRQGDQCESCRYNLACALSKKAELSKADDRSELIKESASHLEWVLGRSELLPYKVRLKAVETDPFLKLAVNTASARKPLGSYEWRGVPFYPPSGIWQATLWHCGIPLERVRFTRLSGDVRSP